MQLGDGPTSELKPALTEKTKKTKNAGALWEGQTGDKMFHAGRSRERFTAGMHAREGEGQASSGEGCCNARQTQEDLGSP